MSGSDSKRAAIYKRGDNLFMHPYSKTTEGFWIFSEPVVVTKEADQQIAAKLLTVLSKSVINFPHPASWKGLLTPLLKASGMRSFDAFARTAIGVEVQFDGNIIALTPTKNGGPGNAFLHLNDKLIRCRATDDELVVALRTAFDACKLDE